MLNKFKSIILILIIFVSYSIYSDEISNENLDNKSIEELFIEEYKSEKIIESEKKRQKIIRKKRLKKQYNLGFIHSFSFLITSNLSQSFNSPSFRENPVIQYKPRTEFGDNLNRNTSIFSSYYNLPKNLGIELYLITIASNPSILAFNPINSEFSEIKDLKRKSENTLLFFKMFKVTKDFNLGFIGGFISQKERYSLSNYNLKSKYYSQISQQFSGWGPEFGLKFKLKLFDTIILSQNLTYFYTDNNYSHSILYNTENFHFYISAIDSDSIPGLRVFANHKSFLNGSLQTSGVRNYMHLEIPLLENYSLNLGFMSVFRKIKISNFGSDFLAFNRNGQNFELQNGIEQYLLTYIFYENIKNQNSFYNNIMIGITYNY